MEGEDNGMRRMVSTKGDPMVKAITVKVFLPKNTRAVTRILRAPARQGFTYEGISAHLRTTADNIEKQWPNEEYALVETGPTSFNFVWRHTKEPETAA